MTDGFKELLAWLTVGAIAITAAILFAGGFGYDRDFYVSVIGVELDSLNETPWGHLYAVRLDRGLAADRTFAVYESADDAAAALIFLRSAAR